MLWEDLRGEARRMLGSEGLTAAESRYDDDLLLISVNRGLRELSRQLPLQAITGVPAVSDQEEYDLPTDFVSVQAVVYPPDTRRMEGSAPMTTATSTFGIPFHPLRVSGNKTWYWIAAKKFHLVPSPDDIVTYPTITIYYERARLLVVDDDDVLDLGDQDEANILEEWMRADMMSSVMGPDAMLSRWKERGTRDDSPIIPALSSYYKRFQDMINDKLRRGSPSVLTLLPQGRRRGRYGRW